MAHVTTFLISMSHVTRPCGLGKVLILRLDNTGAWAIEVYPS